VRLRRAPAPRRTGAGAIFEHVDNRAYQVVDFWMIPEDMCGVGQHPGSELIVGVDVPDYVARRPSGASLKSLTGLSGPDAPLAASSSLAAPMEVRLRLSPCQMTH